MKTINKIWLWILIAAIAVIIIFIAVKWMGYGNIKNAPAKAGDTTSDITSDLNSVDLGSPETDVNQLNSDLNQLK